MAAIKDSDVAAAFADFYMTPLRIGDGGVIYVDGEEITTVSKVNSRHSEALPPTLAALLAAMSYLARAYEDGDLVPLWATDSTGSTGVVVRVQRSNASLHDSDGNPNYAAVKKDDVLRLADSEDISSLGIAPADEAPGAQDESEPPADPALPEVSPASADSPAAPEDPPTRLEVPLSPQPGKTSPPTVTADDALASPRPLPQEDAPAVPTEPLRQPASETVQHTPAPVTNPLPADDEEWDTPTGIIPPITPPEAPPEHPRPEPEPEPEPAETAAQTAASSVAPPEPVAPDHPTATSPQWRSTQDPSSDSPAGNLDSQRSLLGQGGTGALKKAAARTTPTHPKKTPKAPKTPKKPRQKISRRTILIGTAGTLGLVALGARTVLNKDNHPKANATATTSPRPIGGTIPLPSKTAPDALAAQATWTHPIKESTAPIALADGVLTLSTDSKMVATGEDGKEASSITVPGNAQALYLGTWAGSPAAWADCKEKILYAPLKGLNLSSPTTIDVPANATITWLGGSPLLTLSEAQAAGIDAQGLYTIDVPGGFVAVAASDKGILLLDGAGNWKTINRTTTINEGHIPAPKGSTLTLIRTLDTTRIALGWSNKTLTIWDITTKSTKATLKNIDTTTLTNEQLTEFPGTNTWAIGPIIITLGDKPSIIKAGHTPISYDRVNLYGQTNSQDWVYAPIKNPTTPHPINSTAPAIPWGGSKTLSYAVDTSGTNWGLYALKH